MAAENRPGYFIFPRRVAYHETDAMGVVHHSNHIKYFEEARVDWLRNKGMIGIHMPYGPYTFAVLELQNRYYKMARFDDELEVLVQSRLKGARILFQYALWSQRLNAFVADGTTTLIPLNQEMKPAKLPSEVVELFAKEAWDETWPPPEWTSRSL